MLDVYGVNLEAMGVHPALLALVAASVLFALVVGLVILGKAAVRRPPLAATTITGPGPFELVLPPAPGPVALWIRYTVAFPYEKPFGGNVNRTFGMVLELRDDGAPIVFGHGGRHPAGLLEFEGVVAYMTSFVAGGPGAPSRYTASRMVRKLPACPRTLRGVLTTVAGTALVEARISLEQA